MSENFIMSGWPELCDKINRKKGIVMVLGAPDTGKSTLVEYLARELRKRKNTVCVLDGDMGQSVIGPPTTIGLANIKFADQQIALVTPYLLFFVGSTSPVGHLLPTIVGLKKLAEKSIQHGTDITIINTTGFVKGAAAWELKFQKISLLNPGHIISMQRSDEIENILYPFEGTKELEIHRFIVHEKVKQKSPEQRRVYREQIFKEYFQGSKVLEISLDKIPIINPYYVNSDTSQKGERSITVNNFTPTSHAIHKQNSQFTTETGLKLHVSALQDVIVGFNDEKNFTVSLGKVEHVDSRKKVLSVLTPIRDFSRVKTIRIGTTRLRL